jgi:hypothetical protein
VVVPWPRLRELPFGAKLGVACLVLVLLGGLIASGMHMRAHYQNRDERAGLSMDDFTGAYHGVERVSPLITALERNHPEELPQAARDTLLAWLRSDRVSEDYDSLDLGDNAPAEIIGEHCLSCHSRQSEEGEGIGREIPLEFWGDVQAVAFSREIQPTPVDVLAASTHAHALSLGAMALVIAALGMMTSWPRGLVSLGILLMGAGLLADMGAWWLARQWEQMVWLILGAGAVFNGVSALLLLGVLLDLCRRRTPPRDSGPL